MNPIGHTRVSGSDVQQYIEWEYEFNGANPLFDAFLQQHELPDTGEDIDHLFENMQTIFICLIIAKNGMAFIGMCQSPTPMPEHCIVARNSARQKAISKLAKAVDFSTMQFALKGIKL